MKETIQASGRSAAIMIAFAVVFTGLMAVTYTFTRDRVKANEEAARLSLVTQVLPQGSYDNRLLEDVKTIDAPELGGGRRHVYVARKAGVPTAMILEVTAPDGYSGAIDMLVGVLADGRISGVRVVRHKETPGLGDYIEIAKSEWIRIFDGKSARDPAPEQWKVKKDGGAFTHTAGATVTPRAVVKAVGRAVAYAETHRNELLGAQP